MDAFLQLVGDSIVQFALTFLIGGIMGFVFCRMRIDAKKPYIFSQLNQARSHLSQDHYKLRDKVERLEGLLDRFGREFEELRKEIQQIDNDDHAGEILEKAGEDLKVLKAEEYFEPSQN